MLYAKRHDHSVCHQAAAKAQRIIARKPGSYSAEATTFIGQHTKSPEQSRNLQKAPQQVQSASGKQDSPPLLNPGNPNEGAQQTDHRDRARRSTAQTSSR